MEVGRVRLPKTGARETESGMAGQGLTGTDQSGLGAITN